MENILIIDGNNLLFQMFFGMPSKIYNKSGETIHATIGFISATIRLLKLVNASKVICVFDDDGSIERKEEYEEYKANRTINYDELPDEQNPFKEEEKIIKCLKSMNISILKSKNMEADDLIASLAYLYKEDNKVYISSFDSDFFQLIDNNVSIIRYKGKNSKIIDEPTFINDFNFKPNTYVFYKSLVGDNADNIKGIPGIGKKRATTIVNSCSNFDDLINKASELLPKKIALTINDEKDKFLVNNKIISLTYKAQIIYDLNDFGFDESKLSLTNSQILSANKIFD